VKENSQLRAGGGPKGPSLDRRRVIQLLLGGAVTGIAGVPLLPASHPVHRHLANSATFEAADSQVAAAEWSPAFLSSHQSQALQALAERIVPGSSRAKVNRFIDLLLSVDTQDNQKKFLNSLSAFEAAALERFGHPFIQLSEAQQNELVSLASTMETGDAGQQRDWGWFAVDSSVRPREPKRVTLYDHFENLKGWVSGAYYTSEIGMKELGWTGDMAFDSFPGCQHPEGHH